MSIYVTDLEIPPFIFSQKAAKIWEGSLSGRVILIAKVCFAQCSTSRLALGSQKARCKMCKKSKSLPFLFYEISDLVKSHLWQCLYLTKERIVKQSKWYQQMDRIGPRSQLCQDPQKITTNTSYFCVTVHELRLQTEDFRLKFSVNVLTFL